MSLFSIHLQAKHIHNLAAEFLYGFFLYLCPLLYCAAQTIDVLALLVLFTNSQKKFVSCSPEIRVHVFYFVNIFHKSTQCIKPLLLAALFCVKSQLFKACGSTLTKNIRNSLSV